MADHRNVRPSVLDEQFDFDAGDLSKQFEQLLRNRRLNELEQQARGPRPASPSSERPAPSQQQQQRPPPPPPSSSFLTRKPLPQLPQQNQQSQQPQQQNVPAYHPFRSTPIVPCPPQDAASLKFRNLLLTLSITPTNYENPGLLDDALTHVPIDRIYTEAEEEHNIMMGIAASKGDNVKPEWGYQDCVIRSLLRWFKREFFEFVCNPRCSVCRGATVAHGHVAPTPDEGARGANRVELYRCTLASCGAFERFPRYSDVWALMETKRGRAGEFANCFSMLCRAAGARVRWVWNSEDAVWTEIYSEHQRRWVHVDACEEMWDMPRVYTEGWGRKMAYCVAFSNDGATDVTRRYVRKPAEHGLPRTRCPEEVLLWITHEIRKLRRDGRDKPEQQKLRREDEREERELQSYVAHSVTREMLNSMPGSRTPQRSDDIKSPAEQQQEQQYAAARLAHQNHTHPQSGR